MLWFILGVAVWILVGAGAYWWYEVEYYRRRPWAQSSKGRGFICFTDRQLKWLYALWPLTLAAAVLSLLLTWLFSLYEFIVESIQTFKEK